MSEWKECKIVDAPFEIIDGDRGTNYPKQDEFNQTGYCLFLNAKNVTTNGFAFNECYFISKEKDKILRKGKLQRNDIILTTRGTVGNIGFFNERIPYDNIRINSGMVIIRSDTNGILPGYTHQLFKYLKGDFDVFVTGSAQPQLPIRDLKEISFILPPLPEQRAIAGVLSSLDDKIDLLHRQNKTLEGMAEALWRKMFVEEADPKWKKGKLGDIVENVREGVTAKRLQDHVHYVGLEHIERKHFALYNWGNVEDVRSNKFRFQKKDILFGKLRAYFHKVCFAPIDGICSTDILVIRPNKPEYFSFCLLWFFSEDVVDYSDASSGGTRMPRTNWDTLAGYEIAIPPEDIIVRYNDRILPMIDKVEQNILSIRTLSSIRNTLLPKLMSGKVRVKA